MEGLVDSVIDNKGGSMKLVAAVVLLGALLVSPAILQAKEVSVSLKAGTSGIGVEGEYALNEYLGARLGANYFKYSYDGTEDDVNYNYDLGLKTFSALIDFHPFKGSFRLSAGAFYNGNKLDATATSSASYDIGNTTYTGAQLGTLRGAIDYNKFAPYAGLGWDTSFGKESGWGVVFEAGALFQGTPNVVLSADGPISTDATFQQELALEQKNLQDDLDSYKVYPVVTLGVSYRF